MDNGLDIQYLLCIPAVIICGLLIYIFGFKKPIEPPLLESLDDKLKETRKKTKSSKDSVPKSSNVRFFELFFQIIEFNFYIIIS